METVFIKTEQGDDLDNQALDGNEEVRQSDFNSIVATCKKFLNQIQFIGYVLFCHFILELGYDGKIASNVIDEMKNHVQTSVL